MGGTLRHFAGFPEQTANEMLRFVPPKHVARERSWTFCRARTFRIVPTSDDGRSHVVREASKEHEACV
jgi:hypothetical protein